MIYLTKLLGIKDKHLTLKEKYIKNIFAKIKEENNLINDKKKILELYQFIILFRYKYCNNPKKFINNKNLIITVKQCIKVINYHLEMENNENQQTDKYSNKNFLDDIYINLLKFNKEYFNTYGSRIIYKPFIYNENIKEEALIIHNFFLKYSFIYEKQNKEKSLIIENIDSLSDNKQNNLLLDEELKEFKILSKQINNYREYNDNI